MNDRRLKDISIPYGSIKSYAARRSERTSWISIPYGSIKSELPGSVFFKNDLFQFLMVQLKE